MDESIRLLESKPCLTCGHPDHSAQECDLDPFVDNCPKCGDPIDYCQGHGVLG